MKKENRLKTKKIAKQKLPKHTPISIVVRFLYLSLKS